MEPRETWAAGARPSISRNHSWPTAHSAGARELWRRRGRQSPQSLSPGFSNVHRLPIALLLVLAAGLPATASETITIPAYAPRVGEAVTYRSSREVRREYRGILDLGAYTAHGVFDKTMTVIARNKKVFRIEWRVSADVPAQPSPRPEYRANEGLRTVMSLWGVDRLTIEADLGGIPTKVIGAARIGKNIAKRIAQSPNDPMNGLLDKMRNKLAADQLVIAEELVPEAELLALAQFDSVVRIRVGQIEETERDVAVGDAAVKARSHWTFVDADAETVTVTWTESVDPQVLAEAYGPRIERAVSIVRKREGELSHERIAEIKRVSWTNTGRAVLSRKTGATLEASEVRERVALGELERITLQVTRLPAAAR